MAAYTIAHTVKSLTLDGRVMTLTFRDTIVMTGDTSHTACCVCARTGASRCIASGDTDPNLFDALGDCSYLLAIREA